MIVSASRRTDIPAFNFDWFCNRIRDGYVDVKSPFNRKQVSRISLMPDLVVMGRPRSVPYKGDFSSYDEGWLDEICTENRTDDE